MIKHAFRLVAAVAVAAVAGFAWAAPKDLASQFEEAYKRGDLLVANNLFRQIEESKSKVASSLVYEAAQIAKALGHTVAYRDRSIYFLKLAEKWTPEAELTAWYLCNAGGGAGREFELLAGNVAADEKLLACGNRMLDRLREEKRGVEYVKVVGILLEKFGRDMARRADLLLRLREVRIRAGDYPGFPYGEADRMLVNYPVSDNRDISQMLSWLSYEDKIAYAENGLKGGVVIPGDVFNCIDRLDYEATNEKGCYKGKPAALAALDRRIAALKKPFLEKRLGWHYYHVLMESARRPANYYPGLKGAELKAAFLADLSAGIPLFDRNGCYNLVQAARRSGILGDADAKAVYARYPCAYDARDIAEGYGAAIKAGGLSAGETYLAEVQKANPAKAGAVKFLNSERVARLDKDLALKNYLAYARCDPEDAAGSCERYYSLLGMTNDAKEPVYPLSQRAEFLVKLMNLVPQASIWKRVTDEGYRRRFGWLRDPALKPYFDAAAAQQNGDAKSSDPLIGLYLQLKRCGRGEANLCDPKAHQLMDELAKIYPQAVPGRSGDWAADALVSAMLDRYWDLCRYSNDSAAEFVLHAKPFFGQGSNWKRWREMWNNAARASKNGNRASWIGRVHELKQTGAVELMDVGLPRQSKEHPADIDIAKMPPAVLFSYIEHNWNPRAPQDSGFSEELMMATVNAYLARCEEQGFDSETLWRILDWTEGAYTRKDSPYLGDFPLEKLANRYIDQDGGAWDGCLRILKICRAMGKDAEYAERLAKMIAAIPDKFTRIFRAVHALGNRVGYSIAYDAPMAEILLKTAIPSAIREISDSEASGLSFNQWSNIGELKTRIDRSSAEIRGLYAGEAGLGLDRLIRNGAAGVPDALACYVRALSYDRSLRQGDLVEATKLASSAIGWGHWDGDWAAAKLRDARKNEQWQLVYLLANNLGEWNIRQELVTEAGKYRAEAATHLPGIYPVGEKDPAYPLYVAADELARHNSERAWQLLQKAVPAFEREAIKLPPDFTAWALEQLRMARGKDSELLLKARTVATQLLSQEQKILPSLAAACLYTRAESFRDQQNFEAARLEYQTIRNNPNYSSTPYGRKAMFRNVDLMIQMGNASAAEQTIEYWLSQSDAEIQTQAHYFSAKIAFDRQDYDECIKQLKQVFEVDYTHTDARFLHGQWKLATNNEVDETDVPVGSLSDRTIIRPGQQLTVTVQDRNLSVAGGGASIPVIVKTTGGDVEKLALYPSSRDPSLFKGVIEVKLAPAVTNDIFLEVTGADTVSYQIDPAFTLSRGLEVKPPKELTIVDDGRLQIGTGAPRTDGEKTAEALQKALEAGTRVGGELFANQLRPGNPLYIAVQDKDRSLGGKDDAVAVTVKTSSGDILENVELKEVRPFSGVFRGQIPTSLPPPRAFASDSAAGSNPGDVINSTRDGVWTSLADSKPGKWIAVDTMGSSIVSNITIKTRNPAEIGAIRLVGSLGGELIQLGSLPAGKVEDRIGLRRQEEATWSVCRSEDDMRARFADGAKTAPGKTVVTNLVVSCDFEKRREQRNLKLTGAFERPADTDYIRLRVKPVMTKGNSLKGLFLAIAVDGETVFAGSGQGLIDQLVAFDCAVGAHLLEVFATMKGAEDAFELKYLSADDEETAFPMGIFDAKAHPAIAEFLEDAAVVVRKPWGFVADFRKDVRLRTIRWEFSGVTSPDVQVSAITLTDADGKQVLPVVSDFSDAQKNDTLEVAPGDLISVSYKDDTTSTGQKRVLQQNIGSSFNNARVGFYAEQVSNDSAGRVARKLHEAYRFRAGDTVIVSVEDPDCDLTPEADKVTVKVKANSGAEREVTLIEQDSGGGAEGVHSGKFLGMLRTCLNTDTNAPQRVMRVTPEDALVVSYEDRENTSPGVPTVRTAKIQGIQKAEPRLTLFHVRRTRAVDTSWEAQRKLEQIRRRPGNEGVKELYVDRLVGEPMAREVCDRVDEDIEVNVDAPVIIRVNDPSRALHAGSSITVEAVSESEKERAEQDGDEPQVLRLAMMVDGNAGGVSLTRGAQSGKEARRDGTFTGVVPLQLGMMDPSMMDFGSNKKGLSVTGSDRVFIRVLGEDGEPVIERTLKLVSDGSIALMDSTWSAARTEAHVGEKFFVSVRDPDRDESDEADEIEIAAKSTVSGVARKMVLTETLPHSGIFTGSLRPILFAPNEKIPGVVTGAVATAEEILQEDRFAVKYGDQIVFVYNDEFVLPGTTVKELTATGSIFKGADGSVRLFSKRFRSNDEAVLVQFRLAECLFEQAKEHRKLKQKEKSSAAIDQGKLLLEEALKNYPDSKHVVEGEFLLANLYQELASEITTAKEEGYKEAARPLYTEALARFSAILSTWPDCEFAPRAQYHKALCLEMLEDYARSSEEYVKMTYLYPESELVGDATIRLATYYYKSERRYDIAAKIYSNFAKRFPNHSKAARCLFMSGSCFVKQAEEIQKKAEEAVSEETKKGRNYKYRVSAREKDLYKGAVEAFDAMAENYRDTIKPELRAQAMYWGGDASFRREDYPGAYLRLKRCVFEFPETEWARRARGLLLQEAPSFEDLGQ